MDTEARRKAADQAAQLANFADTEALAACDAGAQMDYDAQRALRERCHASALTSAALSLAVIADVLAAAVNPGGRDDSISVYPITET